MILKKSFQILLCTYCVHWRTHAARWRIQAGRNRLPPNLDRLYIFLYPIFFIKMLHIAWESILIPRASLERAMDHDRKGIRASNSPLVMCSYMRAHKFCASPSFENPGSAPVVWIPEKAMSDLKKRKYNLICRFTCPSCSQGAHGERAVWLPEAQGTERTNAAKEQRKGGRCPSWVSIVVWISRYSSFINQIMTKGRLLH